MSDNDLILRGDALEICTDYGFSRADECRHAIAAIPAAPAPTVKVKPLVWDDFEGVGAKASGFYNANYMIQFWHSQGKWEVALSYPGYQTGYDGERWHHTLEAAKAAAQADYEARILAAIKVTP